VLAARQDIRGGAATQERALFEQPNTPAGLSQRDAGCQTR